MPLKKGYEFKLSNSYIFRSHADMTPAYCGKCEQEKLPSEYYTHSIRNDGVVRYRPICKECRRKGKRTEWARPKHKKIIELQNQKCKKCNSVKPLSEFYSNGCFADGVIKYRSTCKECVKKKTNNIYPKIRNKKIYFYNKSAKNYLAHLVNHATKRKIGSNIDTEFIVQLWEKQQGKCALTNIEMTRIYGEGRLNTNVSIDRIDSFKPYAKDNVQLVCLAVNIMKQQMSTEELAVWCERVIKHVKKN